MGAASRLPNFDRLSVLIATILLAYTSARFVSLPARDIGIQLPGFYLGFQLNANTAIAILVTGLAASGTYWLLLSHQAFRTDRIFQHLLLPAMTALVIGVPLNNLPFGGLWWAVFVIGGLILSAVLTAEYIAIDSDDLRQPAAAAVLTALSFALFLILAISLRATGVRLFLLLPPLVLAGGLICLRTIHLRLHGRWLIAQAIAVGLIIGQIAAAMHYLPVSPITFGLIVVGPAYALTTFLGNLSQGQDLAQAAPESVIILVISLGIALWIR